MVVTPAIVRDPYSVILMVLYSHIYKLFGKFSNAFDETVLVFICSKLCVDSHSVTVIHQHLSTESGQPEDPLDREFLAREMNIACDESSNSV